MESNEAVVLVYSQLESPRRDGRYRNSNAIVKALTRRYVRIECSVLMQKKYEMKKTFRAKRLFCEHRFLQLAAS